MSYSANAHIFYGFMLPMDGDLPEEIVEEFDGYGRDYDKPVRLVGLGDFRCECNHALAITASVFEVNEFDGTPVIKMEKLLKSVPDNADDLLKAFCEKAGVKFGKPEWRVGISVG